MDRDKKVRAIEYFETEILKSEKSLSQIPIYIGIGALLLIIDLFLYSSGYVGGSEIIIGIAIVGGIILFGGTASFLFDDLKGDIEKHQSHIKQIEREIEEAKVLMKKGGADNLKQAIKIFETYLIHEDSPLIEAKEKLAKELGCKIEDLDQFLNTETTSPNSELKNTCKRCGKIWYLGPDELEQLEGQLTKSATFVKQMGGIGMISAMFNPMLAAQQTTSLAATSGVMKSQVDELNEKSRCPECQSKNIDRVLVDGNEKIDRVRAPPPQETNKKGESSLADELKKLSDLKEQGILDEEEFKTAKRKLMEN